MPLDSLAFTGWLAGQMPSSGATHGGNVFFGSGSAWNGVCSGGQASGTPSGESSDLRRSMVTGADRARRSFATTKTSPTSSPSHNPPRSVRRITGVDPNRALTRRPAAGVKMLRT